MVLAGQKWLQVLFIGVVLFAATDITLRITNNINYFPTVMMLGAFTVPVVFVTYFYQQETLFNREPGIGSILPTVLLSGLLGGLIGLLAAGILEFTTLSARAPVNLIWIGPIEEFSKLIVPIALYIMLRNRFRTELDGLLIGVTVGMAFSALETMGYELVTLINSQGSLNALNETILIRGLLSPAGHAAWTGLITTSLWRERERTGKAFNPVVLVVFLLAVALHTLWDYASYANSLLILVPSYVAISGVSLGLLWWRFREARRRLVALPL